MFQVTVLEHVTVYWVGATAGAILAMYTTPFVRKILVKIRICPTIHNAKMLAQQPETLLTQIIDLQAESQITKHEHLVPHRTSSLGNLKEQ